MSPGTLPCGVDKPPVICNVYDCKALGGEEEEREKHSEVLGPCDPSE